MYHLFPLFGGAIACIMMTINGMMTTAAGSYFSTVVLHIGGLLFLIVLFAVRREKVHLFPADIPWKEYLGGVIGVATVVMNNHAFGGVSVSAMVALALLGQTVSSAVIDQFGLLGMPKRLFRKERLAGYAFMLLGILVMLFPFSGSGSRLSAVLLLLAGGVTVVDIYYNRNEYTIEYKHGNNPGYYEGNPKAAETVGVFYEDTLEGMGYENAEISRPEGIPSYYETDGKWYIDPDCTMEYKFTGLDAGSITKFVCEVVAP